jgi:hypothetical protein
MQHAACFVRHSAWMHAVQRAAYHDGLASRNLAFLGHTVPNRSISPAARQPRRMLRRRITACARARPPHARFPPQGRTPFAHYTVDLVPSTTLTARPPLSLPPTLLCDQRAHVKHIENALLSAQPFWLLRFRCRAEACSVDVCMCVCARVRARLVCPPVPVPVRSVAHMLSVQVCVRASVVACVGRLSVRPSAALGSSCMRERVRVCAQSLLRCAPSLPPDVVTSRVQRPDALPWDAQMLQRDCLPQVMSPHVTARAAQLLNFAPLGTAVAAALGAPGPSPTGGARA